MIDPCTTAQIEALFARIEGAPGWHYGKELSGIEQAEYRRVLETFGFDDCLRAVDMLIDSLDKRPTVHQLRDSLFFVKRKREEWETANRPRLQSAPGSAVIPPEAQAKLDALREKWHNQNPEEPLFSQIAPLNEDDVMPA